MIIKRFLLFLCAAAMLLLAGCGGNSISVFNWGDYIDDEVLKMFRKETGIRVIYNNYASNEEMYTIIKNGGSEYDLLFPSDYMIERMINEDMLEKLDYSNIPNMYYTDDRFRNLPYDPDELYSVPYMWGTVGILYNTTMVDEPVDSWDILWNPQYAGNIFMYSSMRDTIGIALIREGFSLNSTDINELNAAKRALIEQKPLVRAYVDDAVKDSMIGGEAALALVYSGDAIYSIEENGDLNYAVPKEGSNVFYDAMVIPKGAKNKEKAEMFINFLCRPDIALMNTNYIGYATTNAGAFQLLYAEVKNNPHYWTPDEIYYNCEAFRDLGDFLEEYNRAWTEILAAR
jgi:spermidine/putrescine transport system substrate-binding protein